MDEPELLREFWTQPHPEGNDPADYIVETNRSELLGELIAEVPKDARILEVGCNVGRNLAWLVDHGWSNVEGVEISPHAVELLRSTYPQLASAVVHVGAAEDILPGLPDDGFDLVFTMAVLEHIHPTSGVVFDRIATLAPRVLAIEPKGHQSHRQFAHDIPAVFSRRGLRLESAQFVGNHRLADPSIRDYTAWTFVREA